MRDSVVHQDARYARNRELRIEVNVLIIRATSCTLRGINKKRPSHHECHGRLIYFFNTNDSLLNKVDKIILIENNDVFSCFILQLGEKLKMEMRVYNGTGIRS